MNEQNDNQQLLEIYKLHAELANNVSQRREGANRLYASILTAFLAAVAFMARWGEDDILNTPVFLLLCGGLGMGVCVSWCIVISTYRRLNKRKFTVLLELENELLFSFFRREEILKNEEDKTFRRLTYAERVLPGIFGVAYFSIFIYGSIMLL